MKKETQKKVLGGIGIGLVAGLVGVGGGFLLDKPDTVTVTEVKTVEVPTPFVVEKPVEVEKEVIVEKEVPVEVEKIVEVEDTEMLKLLCDREMYDDIQECKEEVKAEDAALKLAIEEIKKEFADVLEDEDIVADEDEVEIVTIYDDFEDIKVKKSDFEDDEYRFEITVKVDDEDQDEKMKVVFDVEVEDGESKILDVEKL